MKKLPKCATCALLTMALAGTAYAEAVTPATPGTEEETLYLDTNMLSVSMGYMTDFNNGLSVDSLIGGTISIGYAFGETASHYQTFCFKTGMFYGSDTPHSVGGDSMCHIEQRVIPILLNYAYHFKMTEKVSAYAGLEGGIMYSGTNQRYSKQTLGYGESFPHTKIPAVIGLEVGLSYKLSDSYTWDIGASVQAAFNIFREVEYSSDATSRNATFTTIHTGITYTF